MHLRSLVITVASVTGCVAAPDAELDPVTGGGGKADSAWEELIPGGWDAIAERCAKPAADAPFLRADDFHWWYTHAEMAARFAEIYDGDKRLHARAYYEAETETFVMPHVPSWGGRVELSRRLVENVSRHISNAIEKRYGDFVFFPDMGHSHFFIPTAHWDEHYAGTPVAELSAMYTRLLDDPELVVLYHTAEQLKTHDDGGALLPDPDLQYRFENRNPIGDNKGLGRLEILRDETSAHNTVRDYEGHRYYSAGFNVSANKDGCFPYAKDGEIYFFDLSLYDLP